MKNLLKVFLVLVLAVFAIGFYSVKAEELETVLEKNKQTEVEEKKDDDKPTVQTSESNKGEDKEVEVKETPTEKEETPAVVEDTNTTTNNEEPKNDDVVDDKPSTPSTTTTSTNTNTNTKDGDDLDQDVEDLVHTSTHNHCVIFINKVTGKEIQRGCTPSGTSGAKTFPKSQYKLLDDFSLDGYTYVFNGWYDASGNLLTTEKGVRVPLSDPGESCKVIYVYAYFDGIKEPIYTFNLFDYISDTTHSWNNTNGSWVNPYTFTFKTPTARNHYMFLFYKFGDQTFNPGDKYSHNVTGQGAGSEVTEDFYAWWQADVTLSLYDGSKLLGTDSSFESIKIGDILSSNPKKDGYRFLGWVDADGNDVDPNTVFYPDEASEKPTPKEVKLYAKWLKVVNISVTKTWDDGDNTDKTRPDSVTVHVKDENDEVVDTVTLSDENDWTYTFEEPELNGDTPINYTIIEDPITGYTAYITGSIEEGFIITNVLHYENVTVTKVWDDFENEDGLRPDSVTIYLYANGEEIKEISLSEETGWSYSFGDLDAYKDGIAQEYTVSEDKVEYYTTTISGDAESGFIVKNTEIMGQGGTPENPDDEPGSNHNPKTGDAIIESIIMLMISISGFASGLFYLRKLKFAKNN